MWAFRAVTVLLPFALLLIAEAILRFADVGRPTLAADPFIGFSDVHPLFEVDADRGLYRVAPSRRKFFAFEAFPTEKPPRTRRVFCLGGSTVKGEPYSIPTSFTAWLELALNACDADHDWDIVNCGGISYASYRLIPILEECLDYQPDLFVICSGHNEFLEDRTYGHLKDPDSVLLASQRAVLSSRLVTLARQTIDTFAGQNELETVENRPVLGPETDPILDYNDSLKAYHWDPEWRRGVVAHYEFNLRRMLDLAEEAGVSVIFIQPPSNLGGFPPLKSDHHPPLSDADANRFIELTTAARENYSDELPHAIKLLQQAVEISPGHAATWYDLGQCLIAAGHYDEARDCLVRARDNDLVPLRMISDLEAAMQRVAHDRGILLVNAHSLLESRTPRGILDDSLLVDHIHPGFDGHQAIASALVETLAGEGDLTLPADWKTLTQTVWRKHFESLDYPYFASGQRFLKSLEGWTQGRGDGPPAAERFPWRIRSGDGGITSD